MKTSIDRPNFAVADSDLERAKQLQKELDRLSALVTSLTHDGLRNRHLKAQQAFNECPSLKKLEELKSASRDREFFGLHTQTRRLARAAVDKFVQDDVLEWARPIVEKALSTARDYLGSVTDSEKARHKELTGQELGSSEVIQLAARPVAVLEPIWRNIEPIDLFEQKKALIALRADEAGKKELFDVARAADANGDRVTALARDYDLASSLVRPAQKAFDDLQVHLSSRRSSYSPDQILEALRSAANPFQAAPTLSDVSVPVAA